MSRSNVDLIVFGMGPPKRERRPFEHDVALHPKRPSGFKADVPPSTLRHGRRFMPWESATPIIGVFEGDGEAINFRAGPSNDWREEGVGVDINDEHSEAAREKAQEKIILEIEEQAGFAALMDDSDPNKSSLGQHLVTLTYLVVLFVGVLFLAAFIQGDGASNLVPSSDPIGLLGGFIAWGRLKRKAAAWWDRLKDKSAAWRRAVVPWWRVKGLPVSAGLGARAISCARAVGSRIVTARTRSWTSYVFSAAKYEPRIAIALVMLGIAYIVATLVSIYMAAVEQGLGPLSIAVYVLFALFLTTGISSFVVTPMVWSRLWMKRTDITPEGPEESYVNPSVRGKYGPTYIKGRDLVVVRYALWGEATIRWANALGYINGEMPMPSRRRNKIVTDVDVANHADQRDTQYESHIHSSQWEKPVQYLALFGIISVALFFGLAVISERGA